MVKLQEYLSNLWPSPISIRESKSPSGFNHWGGSSSPLEDYSTADSSTSSTIESSPSVPLSTNRLSVADLSYSVLPGTGRWPPKSCCLDPSYTIKKKSSTAAISILKSVSFTAKGSEIMAIVGPSGAGKSTLLRIISGRAAAGSGAKAGAVYYNEQQVSSRAELRRLCGFVTQEDHLLPLLTVRETLAFTSWFRLRDLGEKERNERVQSLIDELRLKHVQYSYVGGEGTGKRGISGGERRRVSIAGDVMHNPPVLLLDEPTSGLDSTSALHVVAILAAMARKRGQIVVMTIHQPGHRILQYISSFVLLCSGAVAHCGTLQSLEDSLERMGYQIPMQINPIEFAMEIAASNDKSREELIGFAASDAIKRHQLTGRRSQNWSSLQLCRLGENDYDDDEQSDYTTSYEYGHRRELGSRYGSRYSEIASLTWRYWKTMYRTKQLFVARTTQAIVGGFGLASVYINLKTGMDGVTERLGLFAFTLSFLLSSTVEALPLFLQERRVLMREVSRGMYRVSSYLLANTIILVPFLLAVSVLFASPLYWLVGLNPSLGPFLFFTLVVWLIFMMASSLVLFLGAISTDFILGNSLICIFLGVFFLFSGYFIPKDSIPPYWIFMYYLSPYRYPLDSLIINEYWGLKNKCLSWHQDQRSVAVASSSLNNSATSATTTFTCLFTGEDVLRRRGLEKDTRWENVGIMIGFFLVYRLLSWFVLVRKASQTRI